MEKYIAKIVFLLLLVVFENVYANESAKIIVTPKNNLSLNFKQIPLRDLLQFLAEIANINLVVGDNISGSLTLHIQNVTWQEAFDTILKMTSLVEKRYGNIYFVAKAMDFKRLEEEQNLAKNLHNIRLKFFHLDVQEAITSLKTQTNLLSNLAEVSIDIRNNSVWIRDSSDRIEKIRQFLQHLDVIGQQIAIEARIVHVDAHCMQQLGLHFAKASTDNSVDPVKLGLIMTKIADNKWLDLELTALENAGRCKIIAAPKLMTQNRKPAYIESGEEIPYQEQTSSGATNIAFKKAVLSLKTTPFLTPDKRILLQLEINQNKVSNLNVNGSPGIQTQQLQTEVTVKSGQTIVLGGIFEKTNTRATEGIPYVNCIPILGHLFNNHENQMNRKELLIFVTPKVVPTDQV